MSPIEIARRLLGRHEERRQERAATFHEIVRRIADGEEPGVDELEAALAVSGREAAEIEPAVDRLMQRREWAARVAESPALEAERDSLARKIEAEAAKLKAAAERHDQAVGPLRARQAEIEQELLTRAAYAKRLRETADAPELAAQLAANEQRRRDLANQIVATEKRLGAARDYDNAEAAGRWTQTLADLRRQQREVEAEFESLRQSQLVA